MSSNNTLKVKQLIELNAIGFDITDSMLNDIKELLLVCDVPLAFIKQSDKNTQQIKAKIGFDEALVDNVSISSYTLKNTELFQINDLLTDNTFVDKTSLLASQQIHFYTSIPLKIENGVVLGALVIMDTNPKELSNTEIAYFKLLAKNISNQIKLQQKEIELNKTQELSELISETNPDFVFVKDNEFKIIQANSAFINLYPKEMHDKIIGYTTLESYNKEEADAFLIQDKIAFEKGISEVFEKIQFPNGELRTLFTTKKRFINSSKQEYILGVAKDVTENQNLIELLKKSNEALDEFAYIASHDLKSPLNAINSLVEWIEEDTEGKLNTDSALHFEMIKDRIERMKKMLADLLSFSKIGRSENEVQKMNLNTVVNDCFNLLDKPQDFVINADHAEIILPKTPLEIVLTNLLSNAIKHHTKENGTINVTCEEHANSYTIRVVDDGSGIAPKFHNKIFEKFSKLTPKGDVKGTGLGLSMVEKSIKYYGGSISVVSDIGEGCAFIIVWPKGIIAEQVDYSN